MTDDKRDPALSELKTMEQTVRRAKERFSRLQTIQKSALLILLVMFSWVFYHMFTADWFAGEFHHLPAGKTMRTVTVTTQPISREVSLTGSLEPLKTVNIPAPFSGPVKTMAFTYGEEVRRGQKLMVLDNSDLMIKLRNAESDFIKAKQDFNDKAHWSKSPESRDAQRELISARNSADAKKRKLKEAEALFSNGIISRDDMEQAKEDYRSAKDTLASSEDKYRAELKKGGQDNVRMAEIKLENAKAVFESYKAKAALATVIAPVRGVAMKPQFSDNEKTMVLSEGASVTAGLPMLAIADLESMEVRAKADEVDVVELRVGQKVHVTGEAFPGVVLAGVIRDIASQTVKESDSAHPFYRVDVTINDIPANVASTVRIGMSAELQIVVYENPKAILVPISAVDPKAKTVQRIDPSTGKPKPVRVKTGITTLQDVEILRGLSVGDKIVIQ
ncbi:efflux RND transporter periplasmic adaptor subunit [Pseudodesulfovibrio senegalensis]|uniref:HlyD family efflux transporter periplasmic adaptor subunit n=1 Tax=Pseudodesulfovibrio senegalensis TaxID=1721087 RepID=A0A6N6N163_9BACT|nr:efflux RND transporter periplasmic adaptor subunit [Pseudodesulfovibrio senegalensis]KAB1441529.1 HlyD family efflux transporter periplasmic adaptor subunit [Pseudodesulfovibrio senegalensis]